MFIPNTGSNYKQDVWKLTQHIILTMVFVSFFGGQFFTAAFAIDNSKFNELTELNHSQNNFTHWRQLVINPRNQQQFFIINSTGQVYLVDDFTTAHLVLDLNASLKKTSPSVNLTAIELHPNFALRDQQGYGIFYTAHLEPLNTQNKTKRIQDNDDDLILKFDAVITEWQFSSMNYQTVDVNTKREVLRIGVPDESLTIQQMSFSPHTKSWNEGFGLLYIALNGQEKQHKPLYSGVILRINPAKFGLRSFTVPIDNPYLKKHDISDEIYLLGAQQIKQFLWGDRSNNNLLLLHQYNGNFLLSLAHNNDWRNTPPKNILYKTNSLVKNILRYRGLDLPRLRNKLLILTRVNQQWLVKSLELKSSLSVVDTIENKPETKWQFNPEQLLSNSDVSLSYDLNGEVLVVDKSIGKVFKLPEQSSIMAKPIQAHVDDENKKEKLNGWIYMLFAFGATVICAALILIKRKKFSAKAIVRTQFAQLELSESEHQIGLYHRHKSSPSTIINVFDIVACEVMLNGSAVCIINKKVGYGFDDEKEENLRTIFNKEKIDKMIDGKIRQITLSFTDVRKKNYVTCLYMRKGSDRVTKKSYTKVVDDLIDWCWLIATKINPEETNHRKPKAVIYSNPLIDAVVDEQAVKVSVVMPTQSAEKGGITTTNANKQTAINTELVDALEKLVDLKQQGLLTEEEFIKAKENLLSGLLDK